MVWDVLQVESREDEEQNVKLAEILELLLAAGYFRARIKGLSPFDKVHTHAHSLTHTQRQRPLKVPSTGGRRDDLVHHYLQL